MFIHAIEGHHPATFLPSIWIRVHTGIYGLYVPLHPGHCGLDAVQQSHKRLGLVADEVTPLQVAGSLGDTRVEVIDARAYRRSGVPR